MSDAAEAPNTLSLRTTRVVIFKDGHGLFVKEGTGKLAPDGTLTTDQAPTSATLGTFWVTNPDNAIDSVVINRTQKEVRTRERGTCQGVLEVVKANLGKNASVTRVDGGTLEGKLLSVLESLAPSSVPTSTARYSSMISAALPPGEEGEGLGRAPTGELFVLRTGQGDVLVKAADVRTLRTEAMTTEVERESVTRQDVNHLRIAFKNPKSGEARAVRMFYFRPGIRWIPTYQVVLGDKDQAEIMLQAEVLNEAEDLEGAPVDFVVGVPTFKFKDTASPLTLEKVLRQTLEQAAPQVMGQLAYAQQSMSNAAIYRSRAGERYGEPVSPPDETFAVAEKAMEGSEAQDLFFYSTPRLSLKHHERAAVGVFRATVPYRHVYTWEVQLRRSSQPQGEGSGSPLRAEENKVWHQVVLANQSGLPWTTGPALVLEGGRPLGQDLLTFTPPKREVILPVTAAVSVRGTLDEQELSRDLHAQKFRGYNYTRIQNKATFKAVNSLGKSIRLVISAQVGGKALKASDGGKITITGHEPGDFYDSDGDPAINPHSTVVWELDLSAGKTAEVSCSYQYFLRE